jgi:predicted nucleic acid-binding protein
MTIVIADTSPINYLVPIDEIGILPRLYHRVVIAEDVLARAGWTARWE